ncbi:hypothetical protein ACOSQ4_002566 [Xanthoceras sorbifolium]
MGFEARAEVQRDYSPTCSVTKITVSARFSYLYCSILRSGLSSSLLMSSKKFGSCPNCYICMRARMHRPFYGHLPTLC